MLRNVAQLLRFRAETQPDASALVVDGGAGCTYATWERDSNTAARWLHSRGVGYGTRVGLLFGGLDWVPYAVAYLGVLKAGGTALHLGAQLGADEQLRRLAECRAAGLLLGPRMRAPQGFPGWTAPAPGSAEDDPGPLDVPLRPEDIADILYTSGTTGPAKALLNPHELVTFGRPQEHGRDASAPPLVCPLPLGSNSSASLVTVTALTVPELPVLCGTGDVLRIAALVERFRAGRLMMTPWTGIRFARERVHERHDLTSLTGYSLASAPLPPPVSARLLEMAPHATITGVYTQSEAVPATVVGSVDPRWPTALGHPGPYAGVRVVEGAGDNVPTGAVGEIQLTVPGARRRYLDPRLNGAKYTGGWVATGDLGWLDAEGCLHLFDRAADAIRVGSALVSSIEVEHALLEHPGVADAAVVDGGGHPVAFVVPCGDTSDLQRWAMDRLPAEQVPVAVEETDALPRGFTGKVLKRVLRVRPPRSRASGVRGR